MDRGDDEVIGWSIDGVAAGLFGAAIGACLLMLGHANLAVTAGPIAGMIALAGLRQVRPEPRRFRLPDFALPPVVQDAAAVEPAANPVAELTDMLRHGAHALGATEELAEEADVLELTEMVADEPLELHDRLLDTGEESRVVQLFAPRTLPTPGELARRIDDHLGSGSDVCDGRVLDLEVDAAAALRHALGELRQSLA